VRGDCTPTGEKEKAAACERCTLKTSVGDKDFLQKWKDPLVVMDRRRNLVTDSMRDLLAGRDAFLMGGGPSANDLPLELLARRGIWTVAVNNAAGHPRVRPQAMVCSDPPSKFTHSVWLDPGIMKFIPSPKLEGRRGRIRHKLNGEFIQTKEHVAQCPNVWGFRRNSWMTPDDNFFLSDGACWGNHDAGSKKYGQPKTVCTMLLALRILRFLGARRIFLVGVDFQMRENYGYSFDQDRDAGACASNNAQFATVNKWMVEMQERGVFQRFGVEIYNTFRNSGLRAFPWTDFRTAIVEASGIVEETPDLKNWYVKEPKKK
jgi:hypothetical protein